MVAGPQTSATGWALHWNCRSPTYNLPLTTCWPESRRSDDSNGVSSDLASNSTRDATRLLSTSSRKNALGSGLMPSTRSTHPLTRARLADLLWELRHERPDVWAREAVESYSLISNFPSYEHASCLARALEIAGRLNDPGLAERVADTASRLVLSAVEADDPAWATRFLGAFMSAPSSSRPPQLFDIAQRALEMSSDPYQRDQLSGICEDFAPSPEMLGELRRARVRSWLDRADGQTGLSAFHWLVRAGEEADRFGFLRPIRRVPASD